MSQSGNKQIPRFGSKNNFSLLSVGRYLFIEVNYNGYLPRDSNGNTIANTIARDVSTAR